MSRPAFVVAASAPAFALSLVTVGCEVEALLYRDTDLAAVPSPPDESPESCEFDPDVAGCADGSKCSVARVPGGFDAVCVPLVPRAGLGEACDRSVLGYDDCERSSLCTPLGTADDTQLSCRGICLDQRECSEDHTCFRISVQAGDPWGLCVPTCELLAGECGASTHCTAASTVDGRLVGVCERFGDVGAGEPCDASGQCSSGLACRAPEGICRHYCDDAHPCPDGQACGAIGVADAPDVGICAVLSP